MSWQSHTGVEMPKNAREQLTKFNENFCVKIGVSSSARSANYSIHLVFYRHRRPVKLGLGVSVPFDADVTKISEWQNILTARQLAEDEYLKDPDNYYFEEKKQKDSEQVSSPHLFDEMIKFYENYFTNKQTIDSHRWAVNLFKAFLGCVPSSIDEVTKDTMRNFRQWLLLRYPNSQNTASKKLGYVAKFFNQKEKDDPLGLYRSPAHCVTIKKVDVAIVYLDDDELEKLTKTGVKEIRAWALDPQSEYPLKDGKAMGYLKNLKDNVFREVTWSFWFDVEIGLRTGDLHRLTFADCRANVTNQIYTQKTNTILPTELSNVELEIINEIKAVRGKWKPSDNVFQLPRSTDVSRVLHGWQCASGIDISKKMEHRLARRTLASRLVNNGESIYISKEALAHKSVRTTEKYYAKLSGKIIKKAKDSLPRIERPHFDASH